MPFAKEIMASDASDGGIGGVFSEEFSEEERRKLIDAVEWKGSYTTLFKAEGVKCKLDAFDFIMEKDFEDLLTYPLERGDGRHINIKEAQALWETANLVEKRADLKNKRVLVLCDSSVVVGAVAKGRTSMWVPSAVNPADCPSRRVQS
eukprot:Awhi_evm2s2164